MKVMKLIQAQTLAGAHEQVIRYILRDGRKVIVNGVSTLETDITAMVVDRPLDHPRFVRWLPYDQQFMDRYALQIINGNHDLKSQFEYDYHERLYHWGKGKRDQIKYICDKLSNDPTSRRAVAATWHAGVDEDVDDVPCLQLLQCVIRDGRLLMKVVFRSNDMLLAAGPNMYGLTELQKEIARIVSTNRGEDIACGTYTHISLVPHIYDERDADYIKGLI